MLRRAAEVAAAAFGGRHQQGDVDLGPEAIAAPAPGISPRSPGLSTSTSAVGISGRAWHRIVLIPFRPLWIAGRGRWTAWSRSSAGTTPPTIARWPTRTRRPRLTGGAGWALRTTNCASRLSCPSRSSGLTPQATTSSSSWTSSTLNATPTTRTLQPELPNLRCGQRSEQPDRQ